MRISDWDGCGGWLRNRKEPGRRAEVDEVRRSDILPAIWISLRRAYGVIEMLAKYLPAIGKGNMLILCIAVFWGSSVFSSILAFLFVITMVPMLKYCMGPIAAAMGVSDAAVIQKTIAEPLWWSLALGACLGGNGTLIGASANVVTAHICERNKYPISFMLFSKYGFLFMLCSIAISTVYLWLRYF